MTTRAVQYMDAKEIAHNYIDIGNLEMVRHIIGVAIEIENDLGDEADAYNEGRKIW